MLLTILTGRDSNRFGECSRELAWLEKLSARAMSTNDLCPPARPASWTPLLGDGLEGADFGGAEERAQGSNEIHGPCPPYQPDVIKALPNSILDGEKAQIFKLILCLLHDGEQGKRRTQQRDPPR